MNRILLPLLIAPSLMAQTVTTQPVVVTTTAPVTNSMSASCTVPRNGGTCKFNFPSQTLAPLKATVPGQTNPVNSPPTMTYTFTCPNVPALPNGQPDLTQPLTCTATVKK